MKYEGYFALAEPLAALMLEARPRWQHPIDLALPIPLHADRRRERGYNQSELLLRAMLRHITWKSDLKALRRSRPTRPQVGLDMTERKANVSGAFAADASRVAGHRILLVDDVCTTGTTLNAAAEALLAAGAWSVTAYCLAIATGEKDYTRA
jgi:ComF family protein